MARMVEWNRVELGILIVPPPHAKITNGIIPILDPDEYTSRKNSYLAMVEKALHDWRDAINAYGPDWPRNRVVLRAALTDFVRAQRQEEHVMGRVSAILVLGYPERGERAGTEVRHAPTARGRRTTVLLAQGAAEKARRFLAELCGVGELGSLDATILRKVGAGRSCQLSSPNRQIERRAHSPPSAGQAEPPDAG